jgi:crotonobetainyl-CoA:carnitine CoA-transferase CaiB-like acyl-CoA transferase
MYATVAMLAALARRERTGTGDHIDIAMLDVSVAMLANQAMNYLVGGTVPERKGNRHPNIQPQDVFATADGHLALAVGNDEQFSRFAQTLGRPEWAADERYATNAARVTNLAHLHPLIAECLKQRPLASWLADLGAANVPCGPINTIPMVFEDPQVKHREMLRDLHHPLAGTINQVVSPMRFAHAPLEFRRAPPLLGEHTEEILTELRNGAVRP